MEALASSLVALFERALPAAAPVAVTDLQPVFGGNARRAWSFDLHRGTGDTIEIVPCVVLIHGSSRQIDTNIEREFRALRALDGHQVRAPAALAVDTDGAFLGAPGIVMSRMRGKADAVHFLKLPRAEGEALTNDLAETVGGLHAVPCNPAMLGEIQVVDPPRAIAARQVQHWRDTFVAQRLEPLPVMKWLFDWLVDELPEPTTLCLVHGDLRPGNFLYEDARVTALLDWEMAHIGDPVEDLAWIFRPMWSPEHYVSQRKFLERYMHQTGRVVTWSHLLYYRVFSELKFATISLTAVRGFLASSRPNLRHADRAATVAPCLQRCLELLAAYREEVRGA